jgi:beta-glucosidase
VTVNASVQINGTVDGFEVAQLYLGIPNGPIRQLRGFEKIFIASGKSVTVNFTLTRRDLSSWDVKYQQWALQNGDLYGLCWSIEPGLAVERYLRLLLIDTLCKGDR